MNCLSSSRSGCASPVMSGATYTRRLRPLQPSNASSRIGRDDRARVVSPIHGHPLRQVDRVLSKSADRCAILKVLAGDEVLLDRRGRSGTGYPPALLVEALAQAGLPLSTAVATDAGPAADPAPEGPGLIVAMDGVRIHRVVRPGDRLRIDATLIARLGTMIRVRSRAVLEDATGAPGALVAEGEFTLAAGPLPSGGGE